MEVPKVSARGGRRGSGGSSGVASASHRRGASSRHRRRVALVLLALLAGASLTPLAPVEAQTGGSAPWFGPHDKSRPTEGFAVRIPVTVENPHDHPVKDRPVSVSLDFGEALVKAGWTSQAVNAEERVRGFTLDVNSIRVVEYDRGFRAFLRDPPELVPYLFAPSRYTESSGGREFHPANNPVGTLSWIVEGTLEPGVTRFYMVYFSPLEYGTHAPPVFDPAKKARAEAIGWNGLSHVLYGYENGADTGENRIHLMGTGDKTTVTVYVHRYSAFVPDEPDDPSVNNPMLLNATEQKIYSLPANTLYKIVADKPILAAVHGALHTPSSSTLLPSYGEGAYIPSLDGGWKGRSFMFPQFTASNTIIATESGSSTVTFSDGSTATVSSGQPIVETDPGQAPRPGDIPFRVFATVSGPPVMMMYSGGAGGAMTPVPSRHGGPAGTDFYGRITPEGGVTAFGFDAAAVRVIDTRTGRNQVYPPGSLADTPPHQLTPGVASPLQAPPDSQNPRGVVRVLSTSEPAYVPTGGAGDVTALVGGPGTVGSFGGRGGMHFLVPGPVAVIAHYDETRVRFTEPRLTGPHNTTLSMSQDQVVNLPGPSGDRLGRYEITSNKPLTVLSTEPVNLYARFLTGRLHPLPYSVGGPEFRGPLVEIESPDHVGRQVFKTTGPDQPVNFTLRVLNLGRWQGGESLPDDIRIQCVSNPPQYEATGGCGETFSIASRSARQFTVTVTPRDVDPRDPQMNSGQIEVVAVSSAGEVKAKIRLVVRVEITYGVGLWLDREGGPKEIVDPPTFVDPGETVDPPYTIVVKNLGSVRDAFEIKHQEPTPGWGIKLLHNDKEARLVTLDAGQSATLTFHVTAPDTRDAAANFVEVTASSQASRLAADKVTIATRIRPDIKFAMGLDERTKLARPNETVEFNVSVENRGNDIFRVTLNQENQPPEGWQVDLAHTEIDLSPGAQGRQNITLRVTPPPTARAGELVTLNIRGESTVGGGATSAPEFVAATVLVRSVHNLTYPAPLPVVVNPGETLEYTLRLTNHGNGNELLEIDALAAEPRWSVASPAGEIVPLAHDDAVDVPLEIQVPARMPAGLVNFTFPLKVSREARVNVTLPVEVAEVRGATFRPEVPLRLAPGQGYEFPLRLVSEGNVPANLTLRADLPAGWSARFFPDNLSLDAFAGGDVTVRINASRDAADGDYPVRLLATPRSGGTSTTTPLNVTVARPSLAFGTAVLTGDVRAGELVLVSAPVVNTGDIEALDVRVALLVNGNAVDFVTLNRIPVNSEKLATLKWTVEGGVDEIRLVLNPDGAIADATVQDDEAVVYDGRGLPGPGVVLVIALLVLVGGMRGRGWR